MLWAGCDYQLSDNEARRQSATVDSRSRLSKLESSGIRADKQTSSNLIYTSKINAFDHSGAGTLRVRCRISSNPHSLTYSLVRSLAAKRLKTTGIPVDCLGNETGSTKAFLRQTLRAKAKLAGSHP